MTRHLASVDELMKDAVALNHAYIRDRIAQYFANQVVSGEVVHNVETDVFCVREKATPEFLAEATAAYARMVRRMDVAS